MKKLITPLALALVLFPLSQVAMATEAPPDGSLAHFSIPVKNAENAKDFYENLFGWTFQKLFPGSYLIKMPGAVSGGIAEDAQATPGKGVVLYIHFKDIDAVLLKAKGLGGTDIQGPFSFPGGRYATFLDLDGNKIGLSSFDEK